MQFRHDQQELKDMNVLAVENTHFDQDRLVQQVVDGIRVALHCTDKNMADKYISKCAKLG